MNAYSHVEVDFEIFSHFLDNFDHFDTELDHIVSLLAGVLAVVLVSEAHDHIAISDGIDLEEVQFLALDVEIDEETAQHLYHSSR